MCPLFIDLLIQKGRKVPQIPLQALLSSHVQVGKPQDLMLPRKLVGRYGPLRLRISHKRQTDSFLYLGFRQLCIWREAGNPCLAPSPLPGVLEGVECSRMQSTQKEKNRAGVS